MGFYGSLNKCQLLKDDYEWNIYETKYIKCIFVRKEIRKVKKGKVVLVLN
jgi:hypothetical protein